MLTPFAHADLFLQDVNRAKEDGFTGTRIAHIISGRLLRIEQRSAVFRFCNDSAKTGGHPPILERDLEDVVHLSEACQAYGWVSVEIADKMIWKVDLYWHLRADTLRRMITTIQKR